MTPSIALVLGPGIYLFVWFLHDNSASAWGEWHPPWFLRRLLRFGDGPVYPSGVALQVWGLSIAVTGLLAQLQVLDPVLATRLLAATGYWDSCRHIHLGVPLPSSLATPD